MHDRKGKVTTMLATSNYPQEYVDWCRAQVEQQLTAYGDLVTAIGFDAGDGETRLGSALQSFAPRFFNHMVVALDAYFTDRGQGAQGRDGNPLDEVRVLCSSLMRNEGKLAIDGQVVLNPTTSVLGYHVGDEILLDEEDFTRLSEAFFDEIQRTFV